MKKERDILAELQEQSKLYHIDGAMICFTRKKDKVSGTITIAKDYGAILRLLQEARIQQKKIDWEIEKAAKGDSPMGEIPEPVNKKVKSYLG